MWIYLIVWDFIKYAKDHDIMVGPDKVVRQAAVFVLFSNINHRAFCDMT